MISEVIVSMLKMVLDIYVKMFGRLIQLLVQVHKTIVKGELDVVNKPYSEKINLFYEIICRSCCFTPSLLQESCGKLEAHP